MEIHVHVRLGSVLQRFFCFFVYFQLLASLIDKSVGYMRGGGCWGFAGQRCDNLICVPSCFSCFGRLCVALWLMMGDRRVGAHCASMELMATKGHHSRPVFPAGGSPVPFRFYPASRCMALILSGGISSQNIKQAEQMPPPGASTSTPRNAITHLDEMH